MRNPKAKATDGKTTKLFFTHPCLATKIATALSNCLDARIPRDEYLLHNLMSKYAAISPENKKARQTAAFQGTLNDEALNRDTNRNLFSPHTAAFTVEGVNWEVVLTNARTLIASTIGDFDYGIYAHSRFTGGAAVGFRRVHGDPWYKFNRKLTVTLNALPRALASIQCHPLWERTCRERWGDDPMNWVKVVPGNEGFTIPKNAETDRFACKEPTGNQFLQTAVGKHFRTALKRVGIDLNDQSRNRSLAKVGSIDGSIATIDLKSASNSVTLALCRLLFDDPWYTALISSRSPMGKIDGKWHTWDMMSSMGNGYTFELESLIFWALAVSVRNATGTPGVVSVYGDDIIVPTACSQALISVLNHAGFRVNIDKTFTDGPVRESCGGHYHNGTDITPIYIRSPITDTRRVIWFLNALRNWATVGGLSSARTSSSTQATVTIADERVSSLYFQLRRKYVPIDLWGGVRLSSISSLVTPHPPRRRLRFLTESKRIDGVGAVLRTFMYAASPLDVSEDRHGSVARFSSDGTKIPFCADDPQMYYEMYGSLPISSSMTRIALVTDAISDEENSELFRDHYGLFDREIGLPSLV